jgi:hypothetical protein
MNQTSQSLPSFALLAVSKTLMTDIARPSAGWTVNSTTLEAIIEQVVGARMPKESLPNISSILVFNFGAPHVWVPQPGRTRLNGRRIPILLGEVISRKLQISTMNHRQPPFFVDRTLCDNALSLTFGLILPGIAKVSAIQPARLPQTNREVIVFEMEQLLENILIDGREQEFARVRTYITAIRGDLYDYILSAINVQIGRDDDPEARQFEKEVRKLFESFRPLSVPDPTAKAREDRERSDQAFEEIISTKGGDFLRAQLSIALAKIEKMDFNTPAGLAQVVALLQPFRAFDRMLPSAADDELNELWTALEKAERNDSGPLQTLLTQETSLPPFPSA